MPSRESLDTWTKPTERTEYNVSIFKISLIT